MQRQQHVLCSGMEGDHYWCTPQVSCVHSVLTNCIWRQFLVFLYNRLYNNLPLPRTVLHKAKCSPEASQLQQIYTTR